MPNDTPWELVPSKNGEDGTYPYFSANQLVRFCADAGSQIGFGVATEIAVGKAANTGLYNKVSIALSGYPVNAAPPRSRSLRAVHGAFTYHDLAMSHPIFAPIACSLVSASTPSARVSRPIAGYTGLLHAYTQWVLLESSA